MYEDSEMERKGGFHPKTLLRSVNTVWKKRNYHGKREIMEISESILGCHR